MAITTVANLLTTSLKRINVVQAGGTATGEDLADAFDVLNLMLDALTLEGLSVPYRQRVTFALSSTKGIPGTPYTVGTGGDVNVTRPVNMQAIDRLAFYDSTVTPTLELRLTPLSDDAYQAIPQKTLTNPYPGNWYYQPTYAGGLGSLYLWLVPTITTLQGVMYLAATIGAFTSLTQTLVLPPGYALMLSENLAAEFLASTFRENLPPDPQLMRNAKRLKDLIKRANVRPMDLTLDAAVTVNSRGRYSIFSDQHTG